ncbi:DUF1636 domain-containing protein [Anabaena subtropica]|uniref:DUF1636 family protein n=1 Tax=Anabaena subtropica FACHB-260 TaxID=2692884 RepID=A0ABR8CII7_9NOST|nr:DUF1636 family protein [Anabaena subtropica]MBD2342619.1 DUF1636 family protein [Anabaena subtropica FACHB-260]
MTKYILFICTSCHRSSTEIPEKTHRDGNILFTKITDLPREQSISPEIEIRPIGCLWACERGCAAAICSREKPTYLIVDLPVDESPAALIELMQLYINKDNGAISWKQLPQFLQSAIFAQIPSIDMGCK